MKMTINVTESDIRLGECGNSNKCAIARALMRAAKDKWGKNVDKVAVGEGDAADVLLHDGSMYTADLPYRARKFISLFDNEPRWDGNQYIRPSKLSKTKRVQPTTFNFNFKLQ